jgi:hypothetical protein
MFLGSKVRQVCKADNLTAIYEPIVGSLTSHNPIGLQGLLQDSFTYFTKIIKKKYAYARINIIIMKRISLEYRNGCR